MEFTNIKESKFTLVRTKIEIQEIRKAIGRKTDDNIALISHFAVGRQFQRMIIDFEMIEHIEFEIATEYPNVRKLEKLHQLMIDLQEVETVKEYLN